MFGLDTACGACRQYIEAQRKGIVDQVKTCLDTPETEATQYMRLLSRQWLMDWMAESCKVSYLNGCMSPTASITCRHGKMLCAAATKAGCATPMHACCTTNTQTRDTISNDLSRSLSLSLLKRVCECAPCQSGEICSSGRVLAREL